MPTTRAHLLECLAREGHRQQRQRGVHRGARGVVDAQADQLHGRRAWSLGRRAAAQAAVARQMPRDGSCKALL